MILRYLVNHYCTLQADSNPQQPLQQNPIYRVIQGAAEITPRLGRGIASGGERVQWWGARRRTAVYVPFSVFTMAWSGEHRAFIVEEFIKNGGSPVATQRAFRIRQISPPAIFFSGATSKQRFTNNVPKLWKL